jgi:hypothetical protein
MAQNVKRGEDDGSHLTTDETVREREVTKPYKTNVLDASDNLRFIPTPLRCLP